jgi:excisionase family DNA binding protein
VLAPKPLLTPKELADAIGASESSLRRWVDNGRLRMSRTAGGHRRIPGEEAIRFIRQTGATLIHPHVLGLDDSMRQLADRKQVGSDADELFAALEGGNRQLVKSLVVSWYLEGRTLAELFDGPMRDAMHRVGELWSHDQRGILVEHRATEICLETLRELRSLLPAVSPTAPVALGGAPAGDPYLIPSLMTAMIFVEAGFNEHNYGGNTPLPLLADAVLYHRARFVWVSMSGAVAPGVLRPQIAELATRLSASDAHLVLGGRHADEVWPLENAAAPNVHVMRSRTELATFMQAADPHRDSRRT